MNPSAWRKWRVFAPQVACWLVAGLAYAAIPLVHGAAATIATIALAAPVTIIAVATTVVKIDNICMANRGWQFYIGEPCEKCAALAKDNGELRSALAILWLPEAKP